MRRWQTKCAEMCVDINENNYFVSPFLKPVVLTNRPSRNLLPLFISGTRFVKPSHQSRIYVSYLYCNNFKISIFHNQRKFVLFFVLSCSLFLINVPVTLISYCSTLRLDTPDSCWEQLFLGLPTQRTSANRNKNGIPNSAFTAFR